jgi:hypothetical protein
MKGNAESGRAAAEAEKLRLAQKQAAGAQGLLTPPRRIEVSPGRVKEVIVLDAQLSCFMYEHKLYVPTNRVGRRDVYEPCPREHQICPLCEGMANARESYYVLFLTVIDLDPGYLKKEDGVEVWVPATREDEQGNKVALTHQRRLLAVKLHQQDPYFAIYNELGNLRGLSLALVRSPTDKYAPQSGVVDVAQSKQEGKWLQYSEADIIENFGHPAEYSAAVEGQEPVLIKAENADCQPYNYGLVFRRPDAADLRTRYAGAAAASHAPVGSDQANAAGGAPW